MSVWAVFGILAGAISCVDAAPYIRGILRGSTRPHRGTWCIWSVLGVTAFGSQAADGAGWSLLMLGIQSASITVVFVLSISRGVGGLQRGNVAMLAIAAVGVIGWLALSRPVLATVCVVVADLAGALLMLPKTWRDPHSETASSFLLAGAAGGLGAAAVGSLQPDLLLYPVYFGAVNVAIAAVIMVRQRVLREPVPDRATAGVDPSSDSYYGVGRRRHLRLHRARRRPSQTASAMPPTATATPINDASRYPSVPCDQLAYRAP
jgi:hypothetical protein